MNIVLIFIIWFSSGDVRATAAISPDLETCNSAGQQLADEWYQKDEVKGVTWRCEDTSEGQSVDPHDAPESPPQLPPGHPPVGRPPVGRNGA